MQVSGAGGKSPVSVTSLAPPFAPHGQVGSLVSETIPSMAPGADIGSFLVGGVHTSTTDESNCIVR